MADLLTLSSRIIDSGVVDQPVNRVSNELSELADGLAVVESFSHCVAFESGDGLVCFDTSGVHTGEAVAAAVRGWRPGATIGHIVYTHGHADHVGGSRYFAGDAPRVIGHEGVASRLDRYALTNNWNLIINARQFGGISGELNLSIGEAQGGVTVDAADARRFLPADTLRPTIAYRHAMPLHVGDTHIELRHHRGETDDHTWAWFPERRWIMAGDFLIWNFPNAGNPQKVQRYPREWAAALREMAACGPELLVPAHGLPIEGRDRIARVLDDVATVLERLVDDVLAMMNAGATLDEVVHTVRADPVALAKPYLRPLYDEPEFVVRNVWRLYGGWWDGAASRLKPSPDAVLAGTLAELAGGADVLVRRAERAASEGDLRLACHLADLAAWAAADAPQVHLARAAIYRARRDAETSLMSKGIFAAAARESARLAAEAGASPLPPTG